ncbi:urease accessory protein UreD [Corynebacterium sp. A21]|uniref:urease accessory protein UreD n=1 Tax=Corynebacterium sp. A21 TaxID=3457318 RepID=UPI003FD673FD
MEKIPTLADSARPVGTLWLTIDDGGPAGRSRATEQYHQGALRIIRPHYLDDSGQVTYTIVSVGGGYLGGDVYDQRFRVLDNASALLTTQSATKIYRTPQGPVRQFTELEIGEHAVLEYLADQTIAYREATYHQFTHVRLHPSSTFVFSEEITPGWHPEGKHFAYAEMRLHTRIEDAATGRLFLLDNLLLRPSVRLGHFGWTEEYTHSGQFIVVAPRVDQELVRELSAIVAANPRIRGAASLLGTPGTELRGLLLRTLGNRTEDLTELHEHITSLLRERWRGQSPVNLRKY